MNGLTASAQSAGGMAATGTASGCMPHAATAGTAANRAHYSSPDSTYSSEAGGGISERFLGRRSSDGVLLGLGASGPIGPMGPSSAESYRNLHYDIKVGLQTYSFGLFKLFKII